MKKLGDIHVTVTRNQYGFEERRDYEWKGGPICHISTWLLDEILDQGQRESYNKDKRIQIGPYRLREVDVDYFSAAHVFAREERASDYLIPIAYNLTRLADIAYRRFIVTLAIWGFAEYHPATMPSWRDVKLVQWARKRRGHK